MAETRVDFKQIKNTPTTLLGYGITDGVSQSELTENNLVIDGKIAVAENRVTSLLNAHIVVEDAKIDALETSVYQTFSVVDEKITAIENRATLLTSQVTTLSGKVDTIETLYTAIVSKLSELVRIVYDYSPLTSEEIAEMNTAIWS